MRCAGRRRVDWPWPATAVRLWCGTGSYQCSRSAAAPAACHLPPRRGAMAGVMGPSVLLTLHVALAAGPTASAAGRSGSVDAPFSADAFVDSVGVNTHITYTDTIYAKNFSLVNDTLKDLGVRHIRDGCYSGWHGVNELDVSVMCLPEVTTKGRKLELLLLVKMHVPMPRLLVLKRRLINFLGLPAWIWRKR